jgi:hypothetical protein
MSCSASSVSSIGAVIPAVDLIEVDVIGAETPQAVVDLPLIVLRDNPPPLGPAASS